MNIKFEEFGTSLGTREMGEKLRKEIENKIDNNEKVVFDFQSVDVVSHSYADEVFGKLIKKYGIATIKKNTSFANTNQYVQNIILSVINESIPQS